MEAALKSCGETGIRSPGYSARVTTALRRARVVQALALGWVAAARRDPIPRAEVEEGAARPEDVATAAIADWARAVMVGGEEAR
jgi:uncharacterized protein YciW